MIDLVNAAKAILVITSILYFILFVVSLIAELAENGKEAPEDEVVFECLFDILVPVKAIRYYLFRKIERSK